MAPNPRVFLEISIGGEPKGRIVLELFDKEAPRTAEKFRTLCTGERGTHLKGSSLGRVIPDLMCCGGERIDKEPNFPVERSAATRSFITAARPTRCRRPTRPTPATPGSSSPPSGPPGSKASTPYSARLWAAWTSSRPSSRWAPAAARPRRRSRSPTAARCPPRVRAPTPGSIDAILRSIS
ncbi:unnamed protein product [Urochloa humidicola]